MVVFILYEQIEQRGLRSKRELQNEKFLPTVGFEPTIFSSKVVSTNVNHCANRDLLDRPCLKVTFIHTSYNFYTWSDQVKCFVVYCY